MAVSIKLTELVPMGRCVEISNGDAQLLVTIDRGPRIISYKAFGGENFFFVDDTLSVCSDDKTIKEAYGKDKYLMLGGHRIWATPERLPDTYYPDDVPVEWEEIENGARFTPPAQSNGIAYSISVQLEESGAGVKVTQTVTNNGHKESWYTAPWGITQVRKGGVAVVPQNTRDDSPLANRIIVYWPYADMNDDRFSVSSRYIKLRQDMGINRSFKFGCNNETGWCGYAVAGQLFVKKFSFDANADYPDYGCNFESYTDANSLEVEALGGQMAIAKGESVTLVENWDVVCAHQQFPDEKTEEFDDIIDKLVK